LNFWATWCPPCIAEMPALDKLQAEMGGKDFAVVAVSTDREGIKKSAPFYRRAGIKNLTLYNDTRGNLLDAFKVKSLPITVLLDREGRVIGRMEGAAQWDSAEAKALIAHYLKGNAS
jgi:thiol-disulfide isomerase/thioredoxin